MNWLSAALAVSLLAGCDGAQAPAEKPLRVAVLYTAKPALYRDSDGKVTGFLYELEVALGRELQRPMKFELTSFENIVTGVQSGKFDIGTGTDATSARQKVLDIVPLYQGGYTFRVRNDGPIIGPSFDDLCGLTIGITAGASIGHRLNEQAIRCEAMERKPIKLLRLPSDAIILLALQSRRVDAMVAFDWYPPAPGTKLSGPRFGLTQTGLAVRKGSSLGPQLVDAANRLIARGEYARILSKYRVEATALPVVELNPAT